MRLHVLRQVSASRLQSRIQIDFEVTRVHALLLLSFFSGVLRDVSGSWTASYVFSGIAMLCGSALLLADPLAVKLQEKRAMRREAANIESNADL
jgi:hypothetical protein